MQNSRERWIEYAAWGAGGVAVLYLAWSLWEHDVVTEWLRQARPLPFFALMAVLPMFGFPITPFFILAGGIFGSLIGVVGSMIALGLNLAGCHVLAQRLRPRVEGLMRRFGYKLPNFQSREKGAIRFTLAVKAAPGVPSFVKNYGLAIAGVGFLPYFILSMLITGTYGISVIVLGDSLFDHDQNRLLIVVGIFGAIALGVWWWRRSTSEKGLTRTPT